LGFRFTKRLQRLRPRARRDERLCLGGGFVRVRFSFMKSVLLIDDDHAFRQMLTELLQGNGWEVFEAADGEVGLNIALQKRPDVVVCDLLMPRCNGFQFCRAIKSQRAFLPNVRVVVSSGSNYASDRMNALEAGADEYITKPIAAKDLFAVLEKVTQGTRGDDSDERTGVESWKGARLKFWGVRGSIPTPGPNTLQYGGNTSCVELRADGELIILDAGSGIRPLGVNLRNEFKGKPINLNLLISHTHWDHIQGFPFFVPAYNPRNQVRILAFEGARKGLEATLASQMESPYFPISMQQMPGNLYVQELKDMEFQVGKVHIKASFMNHPGICVGFRVETSGGSVAYLPDNELFRRLRNSGADPSVHNTAFAERQDQKLIEFIRGCDVAIMDSQYDAEEYPDHVGWGHSCVDDTVDAAMKAGVKHLFLFHHDPDHDDAHVTRMLMGARQQAEAAGSSMVVDAAREGAEVFLEPKVATEEKREVAAAAAVVA
jgi:phosphoribosyl 1,2-cyclic phosphodiesterase/ActR/RegA family two-component response regulator